MVIFVISSLAIASMNMKMLVAMVSHHILAFLRVFLFVCVLVFHPLKAMGSSSICDCGNYWSYSRVFFI